MILAPALSSPFFVPVSITAILGQSVLALSHDLFRTCFSFLRISDHKEPTILQDCILIHGLHDQRPFNCATGLNKDSLCIRLGGPRLWAVPPGLLHSGLDPSPFAASLTRLAPLILGKRVGVGAQRVAECQIGVLVQ